MAQLAYHLNVIFHALLETFCLQGLAYLLKIFHALHKVVLYGPYGTLLALLGGHEQVSRVDAVEIIRVYALSGEYIELFYGVYLIIPELDADGSIVICKIDIHVLTLDAETAAGQFDVITGVE